MNIETFGISDGRMLSRLLTVGWLLVSIAFPVHSQVSDSACGPIHTGGYGPFDYRTDRNKLPIVEGAHFTPEVETLIRGKSGNLSSDLDYTLRRFPNHHRALISVARLGDKVKSPQPRDLPLPVECYFNLASRFRPDDAVVRMLYAKFLLANQRQPEASRQLAEVIRLAGDNAFSHYNVGLIYFEMSNYVNALAQAHVASALGLDVSPLREQLKAVGQWSEPPAAATAAQAGEKPASAP